MPISSVVLLSGGLDSSLNLYEAHRDGAGVSLAITIDYGQRAAQKEIEKSEILCRGLGVEHKVIDLKWFGQIGNSALTRTDSEIPMGKGVQIEDHQASLESAKRVWVPNRNGLFLNIAAAIAEARGVEQVVPGFNLEEAQSFPDNSEEFLKATTQAFFYSTANHVQVKCYTIHMNKTEMVKRGLELGLPFKDLWPCYQANDMWCGECESCQRFKRAGGFAAAGR